MTPAETNALLREVYEAESRRERAATLRAGLVAAAVYNVHRKKGTPMMRPQDFVREPVKIVKPGDLARALTSFAEAHNRRLAAAKRVSGAEPQKLLGRGAEQHDDAPPEKEA